MCSARLLKMQLNRSFFYLKRKIRRPKFYIQFCVIQLQNKYFQKKRATTQKKKIRLRSQFNKKKV